MVPQVSRSLQAEIHSSLKLFRLEQSWWTNREISSRPLSVWLLRSFIRVIHSKITELTGITEKKLEGCPDFGTVWQDFCKFSEEDFSEGKREIIFWGNCDRAVLLSNLLYHGFEQEENLQLYDLQALFDRAVLKSSQQSALSTALTAPQADTVRTVSLGAVRCSQCGKYPQGAGRRRLCAEKPAQGGASQTQRQNKIK